MKAIADFKCAVLRYIYRVVPAKRVYHAYVHAVRQANAIYWWDWAVAHGDTNYTERYPDPRRWFR